MEGFPKGWAASRLFRTNRVSEILLSGSDPAWRCRLTIGVELQYWTRALRVAYDNNHLLSHRLPRREVFETCLPPLGLDIRWHIRPYFTSSWPGLFPYHCIQQYRRHYLCTSHPDDVNAASRTLTVAFSRATFVPWRSLLCAIDRTYVDILWTVLARSSVDGFIQVNK